MAGMDWFRWHHGSVNDPKFQLVAHKAGARVTEVIAVWACLLEAASLAEQRGNPGEIDFESLDFSLGMVGGMAQNIHKAMQNRGLIADDGHIASWAKRQPKRERDDDNSTDRVKAFRGKQRHETPSATMKRQETPRGEESREEEIPTSVGIAPTQAGEACKAMRTAGMQGVSPSSPKLLALLEAGITIPELVDATVHAVANGKPFAYALAAAEGKRRDSATAVLPVKAMTVPSAAGRDPALQKLDDDARNTKGPSLETLARMAALRQGAPA